MSDAKTERARADKVANPAPAPTQTVEMVQVPIQLNTGRPAAVAIPKDVTDLELLSLFGNILALGDQLRAQRASSRIVMPSGVKLP